MDHAQRGTKALSASDFRTAIQEYTRALIVNPHAPDYYIKRSTAFSRLKSADGGPDFTSALHDAEMAVALGIQRARREHIVAGQMRRAVVLYQQGRIGDAAFVFEYVRGKLGPPPSRQSPQDAMDASMGDGEKKASKEASISQELQIWEMKVKARLAKAAPGEDVMKVTVKELPDIKVPGQEELKKLYQAQLQAMTGSADGLAAKSTVVVDTNKSQNEVDASTTAGSAAKAETAPPVSVPLAPSKVRHEWYQSSDTVTLTLYAKGVPKDKADIEINEQSLSISFPVATGSDFSFNLDPLYAPVDVSNSRFSVLSTKIEVILRKKQAGQKWNSLEGSAPSGDTVRTEPSAAAPTTPAPVATAPVYPTSSKKGVKDWDKLAASLSEKKKKKNKTADSKEEDAHEGGDVDSDLEEYSGDPVDAFFKKLYADADPDTRRAMMKSYVESQGTALSTNWSQVGKGKVDPHPPSED